MKKKLVDLTTEELEKICDTHNCLNCPCMVWAGYDEVCWKSIVESGIRNIEVEVAEDD